MDANRVIWDDLLIKRTNPLLDAFHDLRRRINNCFRRDDPIYLNYVSQQSADDDDDDDDETRKKLWRVTHVLWKALDVINTSEQTLCLLVLHKSPLWSALPQEIKQMVRQYVACRNRNRTGHWNDKVYPGLARIGLTMGERFNNILEAPPDYLEALGVTEKEKNK